MKKIFMGLMIVLMMVGCGKEENIRSMNIGGRETVVYGAYDEPYKLYSGDMSQTMTPRNGLEYTHRTAKVKKGEIIEETLFFNPSLMEQIGLNNRSSHYERKGKKAITTTWNRDGNMYSKNTINYKTSKPIEDIIYSDDGDKLLVVEYNKAGYITDAIVRYENGKPLFKMGKLKGVKICKVYNNKGKEVGFVNLTNGLSFIAVECSQNLRYFGPDLLFKAMTHEGADLRFISKDKYKDFVFNKEDKSGL